MENHSTPNRVAQYEKLLRLLKEDKLGAGNGKDCYYEKNGKFCAIGALLTPEQRQDLRRRKLNASKIWLVKLEIGKKNLEYVTGFKYSELQDLQVAHDTCAMSNRMDELEGVFKTRLEREKARLSRLKAL